MKPFIAATGLAVGASAAVVGRNDQCCFQLTASGGASGPVSQLSDGQNRIGGNGPPATYCISNGAITDGTGRGCILTPPTTQFQCDTGATPTSGFMVNMNGMLEYKGDTTFYACPADDQGMMNIYTTPVENQPKCSKITLSTGGKCVPKPMNTCPAPSTITETAYKTEYKTEYKTKTEMGKEMTTTVTEMGHCPACPTCPAQTTEMPPPETTMMPPQTTKEMPPPSKPTGNSCPTDLQGDYQYPHLIVPVSKSHPDTAYGTQYNATITSDKCTIFNIDFPQSYAGKTCSLIFLFPEQSQLQTSSYDISGSGDLVFSSLSGVADQSTTYNNAPSKKMELGSIMPHPGNAYSISTYDCPAGKAASIEVCGTGDLSLSYFQDYNPAPIGLYVRSC